MKALFWVGEETKLQVQFGRQACVCVLGGGQTARQLSRRRGHSAREHCDVAAAQLLLLLLATQLPAAASLQQIRACVAASCVAPPHPLTPLHSGTHTALLLPAPCCCVVCCRSCACCHVCTKAGTSPSPSVAAPLAPASGGGGEQPQGGGGGGGAGAGAAAPLGHHLVPPRLQCSRLLLPRTAASLLAGLAGRRRVSRCWRCLSV